MNYIDPTGRFQVNLLRNDINKNFLIHIIDRTTMKHIKKEIPMEHPLIDKTSLDEYIWARVEAIIEDEIIIEEQKE